MPNEQPLEQDETAWLIELGSSEPCSPRYWGGVHGWTRDNLKAVRFAREVDAQSIAESMSDGAPDEYRLADHIWVARTPPPTTDDEHPDRETIETPPAKINLVLGPHGALIWEANDRLPKAAEGQEVYEYVPTAERARSAEPECTCAEISGENPDCARHHYMNWFEANDLKKRFEMHEGDWEAMEQDIAAKLLWKISTEPSLTPRQREKMREIAAEESGDRARSAELVEAARDAVADRCQQEMDGVVKLGPKAAGYHSAWADAKRILPEIIAALTTQSGG